MQLQDMAQNRVATNLRTGLDLQTGPYCCENTNLRTGLDQWTRQLMARSHGYNKQSIPTNLCSVPTHAWATLKNDTWGRIIVASTDACRTDYQKQP